MAFEKKVPEWRAEGNEPPESLKTSGFTPGYKPPADYFNWFWHSVSEALSELQEKANSIQLSEKADLNNVVEEGEYYYPWYNETIANTPVHSAFHLSVKKLVEGGVVQEYYQYSGGKTSVWHRQSSSSAWYAWTKVATTDDAVKKSGDTMTGQLGVASNGSPIPVIINNTAAGTGHVGTYADGKYKYLTWLANLNNTDDLYLTSNCTGTHRELKLLHAGNGVQKSGDTIAGTLVFASSTSPNGWTSIFKNHNATSDYGTNLTDHDKNSKSVSLKLQANANKVSFYDTDSVEHPIYHTGNKPTATDVGAFGQSNVTNWTGTDLNDFKSFGAIISTTNKTNAPKNASPYATVWNIAGYGSSYMIQHYFDVVSKVVYFRGYIDGAWSDWKRLTTADSMYPETAISGSVGTEALPWNKTFSRYFNVYGAANTPYGGLRVGVTGTTSAEGLTTLELGNSTPTGTANNASSKITMYGAGTGFTNILPNANTSGSNAVTLPTATGTLAVMEYSTTNLTAQSSSLATGKMYLCYE